MRGVWLVVCLLICSRNLEAFSSGPPANRNGVSGVYCTACHITNALNSGPGSVRIIGLPSAWLPGEAYTLQVIVTDPKAVRYGFQFSATGASGDQAGQVIPGSDGRTFIQQGTVNGKALQFIEHNSLGSAIGGSNVFQFTYRTPADASFGAIRFNVAGNAANGNGNPTGDFIYATEVMLPVLSATSERPFLMATRGALSAVTAGTTSPVAAGFARMQTTSGTAGVGLEFISYRQAGVLVSEVGLPASAPIRSGRSYVEVGGALNTGIALVNPNSQSVSVSFFFTDASGTDFGNSTVTIAANSHLAAFASESPFVNVAGRPISDARTFTFNSSLPISAAALRTRVNERGDFMMTALTQADLAASPQTPTSIPHIADGGGWTTEVLLVNNSDATEAGTLQFFSSSGQNLNINLDGQVANQFNYSIPARSSRRFRTAGSGTTVTTGWILVSPAGTGQTPSAAAVLIAKTSNITVNETAIAASSPGNAFRAYAELSGAFAAREPGSIQTGLVISNPGNSAVTVSIEATNPDGTIAVAATPQSIPARGQFSLLLADLLQSKLSAPFTGVLWISSPPGSPVAVGGFRARYNERPTPDLLLTGFQAFDETAASASEILFPQIVNSGGYSTQFVLIGIRAGQSAGSLKFVSDTGQPLQLPVR